MYTHASEPITLSCGTAILFYSSTLWQVIYRVMSVSNMKFLGADKVFISVIIIIIIIIIIIVVIIWQHTVLLSLVTSLCPVLACGGARHVHAVLLPHNKSQEDPQGVLAQDNLQQRPAGEDK